MTDYQRVLPRDLFNEAKLLKCLGQLSLLIYNELCSLTVEHDTDLGDGFIIGQHQDDGSFYCQNLVFKTKRGTRVNIYTSLNARVAYPCYATFDEDADEVRVLDESGALTNEFLENIR